MFISFFNQQKEKTWKYRQLVAFEVRTPHHKISTKTNCDANTGGAVILPQSTVAKDIKPISLGEDIPTFRFVVVKEPCGDIKPSSIFSHQGMAVQDYKRLNFHKVRC